MIFNRKKKTIKNATHTKPINIPFDKLREAFNVDDNHPLLENGVKLTCSDVGIDAIPTNDEVIFERRDATIDGKYRVLVDRRHAKREISAIYYIHIFPYGIPFTVFSGDEKYELSELIFMVTVASEFKYHSNEYDEIIMQSLLNVAKLLVSTSMHNLLISMSIRNYPIFDINKLQNSIQHFDGYICHIGNRNSNVLIEPDDINLSKGLTCDFINIDDSDGCTVKIHK